MTQRHQLTEFRVVLPMTVKEYQVGQLWTVIESSKSETGGGDGVEIVVNEPFNTTKNVPNPKLMCRGQMFGHGQFTHKVYRLNRKLPGWVRMLAPKDSMELHEHSWNAYPYAKTIISSPKYLKDDFYIIIESYHANDRGQSSNIHNLAGKELRDRRVVIVDIANDKVSSKEYKPEYDPCLVSHPKARRSALPKDGTGEWMNSVEPVMCCYKLVKVWFKWFGLQKKLEAYILSQEQRIFLLFHRQVFCSLDKFFNLEMDKIRQLEEENKKELERRLRDSLVRGQGLGD